MFELYWLVYIKLYYTWDWILMVNSIFLYDISSFYEEIAEEYYEKKFQHYKVGNPALMTSFTVRK